MRRGERAGRPATALDLLPLASRRVVTARGAILGVQPYAPPPARSKRAGASVPTRIETSVFPLVEGSGTTFELPLGAGVADLVADQNGGAWLACWSRDGELVYHLDANGHVTGEPLRGPFGGIPAVAIASWRDGFALYVNRRGIALLVSDGTHVTRVEGTPGGEGDVVGDMHSLLVSPDARSILLCHPTTQGIQLLRADLSPAAPGESLPDVWADDRIARAALTARREALAAAPPRVPGRPMETTSDGSPPPRLHAKERIVRQVRLCHVLVTLRMAEYGDETSFEGSERAGTFVCSDGCGGVDFFVWSEAGLVASSYDFDLGGPMGEDATAENAPMAFPDLPDSLRPLLDQLIATIGGNVSGGLWVTAGDDARWCEEGEFGGNFGFYTKTPYASLRRRGEPLTEAEEARARFAIGLVERSAAKPYVVTEEDVQVSTELGLRLDEHTVRALAATGIVVRAEN